MAHIVITCVVMTCMNPAYILLACRYQSESEIMLPPGPTIVVKNSMVLPDGARYI